MLWAIMWIKEFIWTQNISINQQSGQTFSSKKYYFWDTFKLLSTEEICVFETWKQINMVQNYDKTLHMIKNNKNRDKTATRDHSETWYFMFFCVHSQPSTLKNYLLKCSMKV